MTDIVERAAPTLAKRYRAKIIANAIKDHPGATPEETAWAILHAIDTAKHKHGPCPFPYGHAGPCANRGQ